VSFQTSAARLLRGGQATHTNSLWQPSGNGHWQSVLPRAAWLQAVRQTEQVHLFKLEGERDLSSGIHSSDQSNPAFPLYLVNCSY